MIPIIQEKEVVDDFELYVLERPLRALHEGKPVLLPASFLVIVVCTEPLTIEDKDANQYFLIEGIPTL